MSRLDAAIAAALRTPGPVGPGPARAARGPGAQGISAAASDGSFVLADRAWVCARDPVERKPALSCIAKLVPRRTVRRRGMGRATLLACLQTLRSTGIATVRARLTACETTAALELDRQVGCRQMTGPRTQRRRFPN